MHVAEMANDESENRLLVNGTKLVQCTAQAHREKRQLGIFGRVLNKTKNRSRRRRGGIKQKERWRKRERRKCIRIEPYMVAAEFVVVVAALFLAAVRFSLFSLSTRRFSTASQRVFYFILSLCVFLLFMSVFQRFSEHSIFSIVFSCTSLSVQHLFILVVFCA